MADIAYATACHQCQTPLKPHSPSPDFCGYNCQLIWHQNRVDALPPVVAAPVRWAQPIHTSDVRPELALSPEAYHRAWARYHATRPPGLLATLWNLLTRPWRTP